MNKIFKQFLEVVFSQGFDIDYRKTWLADAYIDYERGIIVIGDNEDISLLHECVHLLYDEILEEPLSEKNVEKSAKKILTICKHCPHKKSHHHRK